MTDKITGTNTSPPDPNMMIPPDTSAPKVDPPKAEAPKVEPKEEGFFDSMLDGVKTRATEYTERLTEKVDRLVNADGVLETVDAGIDLARSSPLGVIPYIANAKDLTEVMSHLHEELVEQGKSPLDLLGDVPGAVERVIDNANTLLEQALGDDAPKLARSVDEICWGTTIATALSPGGLEKAQMVGLAVTTEILAENSENINTVLNSNTAEYLGDAADVAAKIANFGMVAIFPPMILLAATGNGPATFVLDYAKDTIDTLKNPDNMRALYQVANGPAVSDIANLKPGEFYEAEESVKAKFASGKGGDVSVKVKKSIECNDDGSYEVKFKMDAKLAAVLGIQAGEGVSVSAGVNPELTLALNVQDAEVATKLVRGDRTGLMLHMLANPGDIEKIAFKQQHTLETELLDVFETKISAGVEVDVIGVSTEASIEKEGSAKFFQKVPVSVLMREQPELNDAMDVLQVMTKPGLGVGAEVKVAGKTFVDPDGPKLKIEAKGEVNRGSAKVSAEMTIEVDVLKAAKHLSMTPDILQEQLENGTLDAETFWQSLPADVVTTDVKFESTIYRSQIAVDLQGTGKKAGIGEKKEISGEEMMGILREFEAKDLRTMAGIRA